MKTSLLISLVRGISLCALTLDGIILKNIRLPLNGNTRLSPELNEHLKEMEEFSRKTHKLNVLRHDGIFLKMLVKMIGAKRCLEIGTGDGYSSIWIASGMKETGGKLTTLEFSPERARRARENFRKSEVEKQITLIEGDALKIIPTLSDQFDFVFIDAWKNDYYTYFQMIYPKVRKGGTIAGHNATSHAIFMKDYLDSVMNHPNLESLILSAPFREGIALSYKLEDG